MSWFPCTEKYHIASRDYYCDAWNWVVEALDYFEDSLNAHERIVVANARNNGGKIKKGDLYLRVSGKYEGDWAVFRADPEMEKIAQKYEVYDC